MTNLFFVFPYFGKQSEKFKSDILKLFHKYFTNHQFHIILTNNFTIGSLFNYKDRLIKGMTASTVYKWSCPNCRAHYIGSSSRNLYFRAAEHAGLSYRTGQPLSSPPQSSIRDHAVICNSSQYINSDHFQIIGTSKNTTELRIFLSTFSLKEKTPHSTTLSLPFRSALLKSVILVLIRHTFFNLNNLRISVIFNPVTLKFIIYSFSSVKHVYIYIYIYFFFLFLSSYIL